MIAVGSYFLAGFAAFLIVPSAVFLMEIIAASLPLRRHNVAWDHGDRRGRIAVLIPAHNEGLGLKPTLDDVKNQLGEADRVLVVADNCTDDTARVAKSSGTEVTERVDPTRIGKGYALDWGLNYLAADPPDIVIVIDADCRLADGAIDRLALACASTKRPIQALYLMTAPGESKINHQVAEFAWRLKNYVRPLGMSVMGLPCQLMGTGMAFPWDTIRSAKLSSGFITEDLKLGLELAAAGHAPRFCPSAIVTSTFPSSADGAKAQRQRWEQGHVGLIITKVPALLAKAVVHADYSLLGLALDLLVPPLSLFGLICMATIFATGLATFVGFSPITLMISVACLMVTIAGTVIAWIQFGRDILPLSSLALIGSFFVSKLRLYGTVLAGNRITRWNRSDRN